MPHHARNYAGIIRQSLVIWWHEREIQGVNLVLHFRFAAEDVANLRSDSTTRDSGSRAAELL